ncbi:MAG: hypothetical protein NT062_38345, partial [Proteobacteria bacterium]|nr:hypothetical protein [Pseudomonadota bacterium]
VTLASGTPTTIEGVAVTSDIYAMTIQDVKNKYTALGKAPIAGTAFVTVDLRRNNGTPLVGVPLASVTLLDGQTPPQPVAGVVPYFYDTSGNPSTAELTSAAYGTPLRARVAFIDVPPGNYQVSVTYPSGGVGDVTETVGITTVADGAVLAKTGNLAGGGGAPITDPTFATDIYPRLQTAAKGGLGCANCHTTGGPLPYDGPALATLDLIKAAPGVIDLVAPASSTLLTNPLYEPTPPQNHPNATFLDVNDPDYKLILLWITNGAKP